MKKIAVVCLISTVLFSPACSAESANTQVLPSNEVNRNEGWPANNIESANDVPDQNKVDITKVHMAFIGDSKGAIVLSEHDDKNDIIRIYNEDNSLWYEFSFYYEQIGDGTFREHEDFAPFAFHPDYFLLALRLVGEDKNRYEVIVNEDTGLKKFVKKSDRSLKFQTWVEHIKGVFSVKFNQVENPLRESPAGRVKHAELPEDVFFHPVQVKGEWLKVRWDGSQQAKKDAGSGWVKWRDDSQLLVELFYFA